MYKYWCYRWCFEHSSDINCSLLVNPRHADESWERWNTCLWIHTLQINSLSTLENTDENRTFFCSFTTPQAFWQSSAPGALSTPVTSIALYLLTWVTLMSPRKDETRVCGYTLWINSLSTLENIDQNRIFFCSFTTPQTFWQGSTNGALSTPVTSIVLYSLIQATLISRGKDKAGVCGYIRSELIHRALSKTLMRTKYFFVRSPHHKHFGKAQHLVLWALRWYQLFSTRQPEPHWWVLGRMKHVSVDICS